MTVIKAYTKLPAITAHNLEYGASVCIDDGDVSISLAFSSPADLHRFANAVMRAAANIRPREVCDVCGFVVELIGHSAECPKRVPA